jgi:PST family polysaccharide transporter
MIRRLAATVRSSAGVQGVVVNSGWLYADSLFRIVVGVAIAVWVARYLGPNDFGLLNYAAALVAIIAGLSSLGLDTVLVKTFLTGRGRPAADILLTGLAVRLLAGSVGVGIAIGAAILLKPDNADVRTLVALTSFALVFYAVGPVDALFRARLEMKYTALARSGAVAVAAGFRALLILGGATVVLFAIAPAVEAVVCGALLLVCLRRGGVRLGEGSIRAGLAGEMLRDAWPVWLAGVCALLYMKADLVLLGQLAGDRDVGVYAVASKLSEVLYVVPIVLAEALFPYLIRAKGGPGLEYSGQAQLFADVLVATTLVAIVVGLLLATPLIPAVFGVAYQPAAPIFWIHAWSALFIALTAARTKWLLAEGLQRYEPALSLIAAFLVITLNVLFIPRWGASGAAIATVAGSCIAVMGAVWLFRPLRPLAVVQLRALWPFARLARALALMSPPHSRPRGT